MELYLVVPVPEGATPQPGDETIHGKPWRVTGPVDIKNPKNLKFHCVSYVWGEGTESVGSFFNCKREISDQTRPALEAAIKASKAAHDFNKKPMVEAFWIDVICIPQLEGTARSKTLASMGFIYSAAISVIIVLKGHVWEVIEAASMDESPRALSYQQMEILELDTWVNRVWTYQEIVNASYTLFTTTNLGSEGHFIPSGRFFDCVGFSLNQWKKGTGQTSSQVLEKFPNLNTLEDTLADVLLNTYLGRSALGVLSNMAYRSFDARHPQNRLLACLGALTKDVAWGPPSTTVNEIAEELIAICEKENDYSFVYTADERDDTPGLGWRPSPSKMGLSPTKASHLIPVIAWHISGYPQGKTQTSYSDRKGLWLNNMIRLKPAPNLDDEATAMLEMWLYQQPDAERSGLLRGGFFRREDVNGVGQNEAMLMALRKMGFTGCPEPHVLEKGLFFSQVSLVGCDSVELFAAASMRWKFGCPGLARWKEDGVIKYCAGVFVGIVKAELAEALLMT